MRILTFILFLIPVFAFAQYPANPNKIRLGYQTTADGLIWRGVAADTSNTPTGYKNFAYIVLDTVNVALYGFVQTAGRWQELGGGGTLSGEVNGPTTATTVDTVRRIWFDRTYAEPDSLGKLQWAADDGTLSLGVGFDGTVLQMGQELYYPPIINKTGSALPNGTAVMIDTSQIVTGDHLRIMRAISDGGIPSAKFLGILTQDLPNDSLGLVTWFGYVRELDEDDIKQTGDTWTAGDMLYLSATEPGKMTNTEPTPPAHKVPVARVVRKPSIHNVTLLVRPWVNSDIGELNDVNTTGATAGSVLKLNSAGVWVDSTDLQGIVAADTAAMLSKYIERGDTATMLAPFLDGGGTANYVPKFTGSKSLGNSLIQDDGSTITLGGTAAAKLPIGTTAQRPTGAAGHLRWISDSTRFEGYTGSAWKTLAWKTDVGSGLTGSGVANRVAYWSGTTGLTGANHFTWSPSDSSLTIRNYAGNKDIALRVKGKIELPYNTADNPALGTNVIIGYNNKAGRHSNIVLGGGAGASLSEDPTNGAIFNVIIGTGAMPIYSGLSESGSNVAIGRTAGASFTSGSLNFFLGESSALNLTSGSSNVGVGRTSLRGITTGSNNVAIGEDGLYQTTSRSISNSTAIGYQAGRAVGFANGSVFIGYQSGQGNTGTGILTFIGNQSGQSNTYNSVMAIGASATASANNQITLGSSTYTTGRWNITGAVTQATGTTAQRPTGVSGMLRWASDSTRFEGYTGSAWKTLAWKTDASGGSGLTGSGSANHVAYWSSSTGLTFDNGQFYWDATNNRLGLGNTVPQRTLHVTGEARISDLTTDTPTLIVGADSDGDLGAITVGSGLSLSAGTLSVTSSSITGSGSASHVAYWDSGTNLTYDASQLYWDATNNRLGIGNAAPSVSLHVTGEARITDLVNGTPTALVGYDANGNLGTMVTGLGIAVSSGSIVTDFSEYTTVTSVDSADFVAFRDVSASGDRKAKPIDVIKAADGHVYASNSSVNLISTGLFTDNREVYIWATLTSGALANATFTIPDPSATYLGRKIYVASDDDSGTYKIIIATANPGGFYYSSDLVAAPSAQDTFDMDAFPGFSTIFVCMQKSTSYYWVPIFQ